MTQTHTSFHKVAVMHQNLFANRQKTREENDIEEKAPIVKTTWFRISTKIHEAHQDFTFGYDATRDSRLRSAQL